MTIATQAPGSNRAVLRLLASPLHPLLSGRICELSYLGAVTGIRHVLPVEYAKDGARVTLLAADASTKRWWRNFTGVGRTVTVTIRRRAHVAHATTLAPGDPGYTAALTSYRRHHRPPQDSDHRLVVLALLDS